MKNNPQPLFTLTEEEVDTVRLMAYLSKLYLDIRVQIGPNHYTECSLDNEKINNLLTRIKQWQDENK